MLRKVFAVGVLPLALQWSVAERLTGPESVREGPSGDPPTVLVDLARPCPRPEAWRLDGRPIVPRRVTRCRFELPATARRHDLEVQADGRTRRIRLDVRDHLVVSIGDSVASGEGNPDGPGPRWLERRCHRSLRSGHGEAALNLERGDPRSAITFVALACSGATIREGLLGPYAGIQPDRRRAPLPPQVARLRELAAGRDIDAVLVSVGANDVHFGPLLRFCMRVSGCPGRRFDPERPGREARDPAAPVAAAVVRGALAELRAGYDRLAARLRARVPPGRVAIVEYFDPLVDARGRTCAAALPGISRSEADWARRELLAPLNAEVHAAAARHGWRVVGGVADAFSGHGICTPPHRRWVREPVGSLLRQLALTGTMHPNAPGHRATAALIAPVLAEVVGARAVAAPRRGDGGVRRLPWPWLLVAALAGALAALAVPWAWARVRRARLPALVARIAGRAWALVRRAAAFLSRHRGSFVVAVVTAGSGIVALLAGRADWRVPFAVVAVAGGALYPWTWRHENPRRAAAQDSAQGGADDGGHGSPGAHFAVLVVLSLGALVGFVLGVAVSLGAVLEDRVVAVSVNLMYAGLGVLLLLAAGLVGWWTYHGQRFFGTGRSPRRRLAISAGAGALAGVALLYALSAHGIPNERQPDDVARQAIRGQYDLLLVVDPADDVGAALIREASDHVRGRRPGELFPAPSPSVRYDVAWGIAVPRPGPGPRWRLVEPPTTDRAELAEALAALRPLARGRPATRAYGRLLADTVIDDRVRWRPGSQRGVALLLHRLPSRAALDVDAGEAEYATPGRLPSSRVCLRLQTRRAAPDVAPDPAGAVPWADVLAVHCARRSAYRAWEANRRPADLRVPAAPVAMHVLTADERRRRTQPWSSWARALDGRLHPAPTRAGRIDARQLLRDARDLHTGAPAGELTRIVERYRPHLFFDADEEFFPVDVDALFREGGEHRRCRRSRLRRDDCEPLRDHLDLAGPLDEYIDFAGGARLGRDLHGRDAGVARMYVHVREQSGRLYLGYWWYFPFNSSPGRPEVTCLPGLTFKDATCFDHEGDWEGVTVVLELRRPDALPDPYTLRNVRPVLAIYDSHGRAISWSWDAIDLAADAARTEATHPVVYVAAGSHASYPARCVRTICDQRLSNGGGVPEGGFDGRKPWPFNDRERCAAQQIGRTGEWQGPCLIGLPSTRDGSLGVMWNAFPGTWGAATCTRVAKVCALVDGPSSPSLQDRFRKPWDPTPVREDVLLEMARGGRR